MAKRKISKIQSESPRETVSREAAIDRMLGDRLTKIAEHLFDLSDLLFENQDRFNNDPMLIGIGNLLSGYGERIAELTKKEEGGAE